jgi:hypothetical protein
VRSFVHRTSDALRRCMPPRVANEVCVATKQNSESLLTLLADLIDQEFVRWNLFKRSLLKCLRSVGRFGNRVIPLLLSNGHLVFVLIQSYCESLFRTCSECGTSLKGRGRMSKSIEQIGAGLLQADQGRTGGQFFRSYCSPSERLFSRFSGRAAVSIPTPTSPPDFDRTQ